ncbi:MAG: [FeFe] hydrogenase H-cluster radical SAM maturase HydE [Clostridia bacterium]|nr:[FeFe] hydrogenase H-cluster radical SAM maturase HydE [Clostridia bacterium]
MQKQQRYLIEKLKKENRLSEAEYEELIAHRDDETAEMLAEAATVRRKKIFGDAVYMRGLIEISSICKNNCYYCGIRKDNRFAERYRLTKEEIISCAEEGYELGFRTFVLQGGEDPYFSDDVLCDIVSELKNGHPDCAVTLSMGERTPESYRALFDAGAERYLLRHETADARHYAMLHPAEMSFENRMNCLKELRETGYQVGCGFMVGSPGQTPATLAKDLTFLQEFKPEMCGIGPFVPHRNTPFGNEKQGSLELTLLLLSVIRVMLPEVLLPATTALGTIHPQGREKGIMAGANVLMPNLSPLYVRKKYELYDNKICTGEESAQCRGCLEARMNSIGCRLTVDRGDSPVFLKNGKL